MGAFSSYLNFGAMVFSPTFMRLLCERVTHHPSYVQNKLAMTINSGQHTYNIGSTLFYFRRSEMLAATDAGGVYDIRERIGFNRFKTANNICSAISST